MLSTSCGVGLGSLEQDKDTGGSQSQRGWLQCREAQLELPLSGQSPWTPSLGTKGRTKPGFLSSQGKALAVKSSLVGRAWDNTLERAGQRGEDL